MTLSLDLLRRLPPAKINENLETLIKLCPSLMDELVASVDQPSWIKYDQKSQNREYLCCDYNRDSDSFRSPWSNEYDPPFQEGTKPPAKIRELEIKANEAFNTYRQLYFDGGLSSVYLWELEGGNGFAGVVLFKKTLDDEDRTPGSWDSLHVFEVSDGTRTSTYKLTSTVMLSLGKKENNSNLQLAGSLTRQNNADLPVKDQSSHIINMGKMIEDSEAKMRNQLQEVYFSKTKDIVASLRSVDSLDKLRLVQDFQKELMGKLHS